MSVQASYVGVQPRTIICGAVALVRGSRVNILLGVAAVADHTTRGQFVVNQDIAIGEAGEGYSMQGGGKVNGLVSVAVNQDDPAYGDDNGKFTNVSAGGNILVGKFAQAAAIGGIVDIELFNPA
jgi:hypothetical protein